MTNGCWTETYVIKFLLIHALPLLLWSCMVPGNDGDCTGQFPGVHHVCVCVSVWVWSRVMFSVALDYGVVWPFVKLCNKL